MSFSASGRRGEVVAAHQLTVELVVAMYSYTQNQDLFCNNAPRKISFISSVAIYSESDISFFAESYAHLWLCYSTFLSHKLLLKYPSQFFFP